MTHRHAPVAVDPADVRIQTRGPIRPGDVEHARLTVAALTRLAHEPVLDVRVKLAAAPGPTVEQPYTAQANLDVNGRLVRAQAAARSTHAAIHLLHDRLRTRLRRTARDWENLRGRRPDDADHEWRHAGPPRKPLPYFPRPIGRRQVVRRKTYDLDRLTCDEAALDLERLDYDFHLFTETATGQDSVLYRTDGGCRLAQVTPQPARLGPVSVPLTFSPASAPRLTVAQATARLEATGLPFVFFADAGTGRGQVLYHRYDGDYGLITAAGERA
ncbi:HPF/RaiA family ribosome-associated protein [Nonomuraea maheshkhaliensis]|uniref:HPF/RaiA family ribosome-associated protein n=1 Tax=Nonomuraea maheshkhaliensis TaxID=419590 RepID=A0ABP4RQF5_9ACTN